MKTARELELERDFTYYSNRTRWLINERCRNDMDLERVINEATELHSIKSPRVKIHTYSIEKNTEVLAELSAMLRKKG